MSDEPDGHLEVLAVLLLGVIALSVIVEVSLLAFAYWSADEVSCSWYGCRFTSIRSSYEGACFKEGLRVNCTSSGGDWDVRFTPSLP